MRLFAVFHPSVRTDIFRSVETPLRPVERRAELRRPALILALISFCTFGIALSGTPNLMDNERRVAAYVLDAVQNGNWIFQRDAAGNIASKPPMFTWIAALATLPFGRLNRFALYLPSALATMLISLIILKAGRTWFGSEAGFLGGATYLLSQLGAEQTMMTRYDGLFTLPVTLAALAAFRAWESGRGWIWFWLACAAATLVKGPLGVVLAAGGLGAAWWERRSENPCRIRGSHWVGVGLFLLICGGWFWLAYQEMGNELIEKLLGRELVGHAVGGGRRNLPLTGFYEPTLNFLGHFAPWSLVASVGLWRVWRQPSENLETRRFERFLFCWFFTGLLIFSVAAHQRGRLIFPLIPPAALLAGRELARLLSLWSPKRIRRTAIGVAGTFLVAVAIYHHVALRWTSDVQRTLGLQRMALELQEKLGEQCPVSHMDSPFALQYYLNTVRPVLSAPQTARILSGNYPAVVAVSDFAKLQVHLPANLRLHEIARWPATNQAAVRIVSNVPHPELTNRFAVGIGPLLVEMDGARLARTRHQQLEFTSPTSSPQVTISNWSAEPQAVSIRFESLPGAAVQARMLEPSQRWHWQFGKD